MTYYLNLFTPETWANFQNHGANVSGFRHRQRRVAMERIKKGDVFLCYLVGLSRWCGVLDIESDAYTDEAPIFSDPDPFTIRFKVGARVVLSPELSIPIEDERVWQHLSITKHFAPRSVGWAAGLRSSLRELPSEDGQLIEHLLVQQGQLRQPYPLDARDLRRLERKRTVRTLDRQVLVEVPENDEVDADEPADQPVSGTAAQTVRESHHVQALIARIGVDMGFRIWVPRNDRVKVMDHLPADLHGSFLDALPLNYDDTTLRTIEQIDVIWLRNRSMTRAFEVEHTTAIYSGLLRMADLLALQPNMDIRLHIVAPDEKRERVLREIRRPVFSLLDRGPLYESCTFIPYSAIREVSDMRHLSHMSDSILEEFAEHAEDE